MCKSVFRNLAGDYFFWAILILFFGINIYAICDKAGQRNEEISGHKTLYEEFKGELTADKINKVVDRCRELSQIVETGDYDHEGNQPGTYTGYFAGDYGEFQEIFDEYKYRYEYAAYAGKIAAKPTAGNRIKEAFSGRNLDSYYDMEGPEAWLEYDFHTLLCVMFTVFCACKIIVYDRKRNLYILLETCSLGTRKVMARKAGSLVLLTFLLTVFFSAVNAVAFWNLYDMEGIHEPVYAMSEYKNTLFNGSIFQFWFFQTIGIWISCILIGVVCMFLAMVIREELYAMLLGVLVYIGFIALFFKFTYWGNPVGLLAGTNLIKDGDLYWFTFVTVLGTTFLCSGGLIWISGLYQISIHSQG